MAWKARDIKDQIVQYPGRFRLQAVEGQADTYDLIPAPGTVTETGTVINRAYLQPMEDFLEKDASTRSSLFNFNLLEVLPSMSYYKLISADEISAPANPARFSYAKSLLLDDGTVFTVGLMGNRSYVQWFYTDGTAKTVAAPAGGGSTIAFQLVKIAGSRDVAFAVAQNGYSSGVYVCFADESAGTVSYTQVTYPNNSQNIWPLLATAGANGAVCFSMKYTGYYYDEQNRSDVVKAYLIKPGATSVTAITGGVSLYGPSCIVLSEDGSYLYNFGSTTRYRSGVDTISWSSAVTMTAALDQISYGAAVSNGKLYIDTPSGIKGYSLTETIAGTSASGSHGILLPKEGSGVYLVTTGMRVSLDGDYKDEPVFTPVVNVTTGSPAVQGFIEASPGTDGSAQISWRGRVFVIPKTPGALPEDNITWTCPEDGLYKFILVGGGADGTPSCGGGSGCINFGTMQLSEDDVLTLKVGKPGANGTSSVCGVLSAAGAVGQTGGAPGGKTVTGSGYGGGAGGYDLTKYGGAGGSYLTVSSGTCLTNLRDINGGLASFNTSSAATDGLGFGAGGASANTQDNCGRGYPGCVVIMK